MAGRRLENVVARPLAVGLAAGGVFVSMADAQGGCPAGGSGTIPFEAIGPEFFAGAAVVGVDAVEDGGARTIGFDFFPNGNPVPTPLPLGVISTSGVLGNAFESVGLVLVTPSVAASSPTGGLGVISPPNALVSEQAAPPDGPIRMELTIPADAVGMSVADGPTFNIMVRFIACDGTCIVELFDPDPDNDGVENTRQYIGIRADEPICRVEIFQNGTDDYAIEDLSILPSPCLADVNGDGLLTGADFNAWLTAFNSGDDSADQNLDGVLNGADFNGWLANFAARCP